MSASHFSLKLLLMLGVASLCSGADITYDVDLTIGDGVVTGFIETNGSTGTLTQADILDWNLNLIDGVNTADLSPDNETLSLTGLDFSATPSELTFNFSGTDDGFVLFDGSAPGGAAYFCLFATFSVTSTCVSPGISVLVQPSTIQFQEISAGNEVIATAPISGVPEPGTYGLTLIGLWLVFMRKRLALAFR